jgi:hypothetical protein
LCARCAVDKVQAAALDVAKARVMSAVTDVSQGP